MQKWMKTALVILLAAVVQCVSLSAYSPKGAAVIFSCNREAFMQAARDALAAGSGAEVRRPFGVDEIQMGPNPAGKGYYVEFQMGGSGLGPSTAYWGVMFSEGGPLGFQGVPLDYTPDGNGWSWEEPDGDNRSHIIPLEENWYLYHIHF